MMTRLDPKNLSLRGRKNFYHVKIGEVRAEAQGLLPFFFAIERKNLPGSGRMEKFANFNSRQTRESKRDPVFGRATAMYT